MRNSLGLVVLLICCSYVCAARAQWLAAERTAHEVAMSAEGFDVCECCWRPLDEEILGIACCGSALLALGALATMLVWYCLDEDRPFSRCERDLTILHLVDGNNVVLSGAP